MLILTVSGLKVLGPVLAQGLVSRLTVNNPSQNTRKPFGGQGSAPDPNEGAYSAPSKPLVGGEGLAVPSPRTPSPTLGLSGLASPTPLQN